MTNRPTVAPDVVAAIAESAPGRVRKKLDRAPRVADDWEWRCDGDEWSISVGEQTVTLAASHGHLSCRKAVRCTCLLTPRCFHVLACLSILSPAIVDQPEDPDQEDAETDDTTAESEVAASSPAQRQASRAMWDAAARLLAVGARSGGTLLQSHLLRAVHECRSVGLHRLANAGIRVVNGTRQILANSDSFRTEVLAGDLGELMEVAWRLQSEPKPEQQWIGTARRVYRNVGSLRLCGLFGEPILTASGYSGVVTYLCDGEGRIVSIGNVRPGAAERIQESWKTGIDVGGVSLSHRQLSQRGLVLQRATRSLDHRLGTGSECQGAPIPATSWNDDGIRERFQESLATQVHRVFAALQVTRPELLPAGADLLFLDGVVLGAEDDLLLFQVNHSQEVVRLAVAGDQDALVFRDNLTVLARAPGLALRCIARLKPKRAGTASALAIASAESASGLALPSDWCGRVSLGLQRLQRSHLSESQDELQVLSGQPFAGPDDGLYPFRRRLHAMAIGGRHSVPHSSLRAMRRETMELKGRLQPAAAGLLSRMARAATDSDHDLSGIRFPADPGPLAESWLACFVYQRAARDLFRQADWLQRIGPADSDES